MIAPLSIGCSDPCVTALLVFNFTTINDVILLMLPSGSNTYTEVCFLQDHADTAQWKASVRPDVLQSPIAHEIIDNLCKYFKPYGYRFAYD